MQTELKWSELILEEYSQWSSTGIQYLLLFGKHSTLAHCTSKIKDWNNL